MPRLLRSAVSGCALSLFAMAGFSLAEPDWTTAEPASKPSAARKPIATRRTTSLPKRSAVQDAGPRNYYKELFSEADAAKTGSPATTPAETAKSPLTTKRLSKKPLPGAPIKTIPATAETETAPEANDSNRDDWATAPASSVVKTAAVEDETKSASHIEQVRVETRPRTSRVPVPPNRSRVTTVPAAANASPLAVVTPNVTTTASAVSSAISLEWVKKSEFNVGQECATELVVKNTGTSPVEQVAVDAVFQSPVRVSSVKPQPVETRDRLTWTFDTLAPGVEHRIALKLIPSRRGDLGLIAQVRLVGTAAATFRVEEPLLKVTLKGPAEVMLGEGATQMVVVSNPGSGTAHDVKLAAHASEGLEHARTKDETMEMEIGTIMPGESRTIRLPLTGVKGGSQTVSVTASSSSEVTSAASTEIKVISPTLSVSADGPALRYKGRNATFTVNVTNDGLVANNNVRVVQTVAEGFQFVGADHGGKFDPDLRTVSWFLGRLESDQSVKLNCELAAVGLGEFTQKITVASDAGARAETALDTKVDGASSLTMELIDLDDPVEIGVETAYEVRLKNTGTKAATNVELRCELPDGVQLLSAKAPTDAVAERQALMFKTLPQIAPGEETVFRVHVKGLRDGNERVKVLVSSDSLTEPLVQEEQTKFYSDKRR